MPKLLTCKTCGAGFDSTADARKHFRATGHSRFVPVKGKGT